MPLIELTRNHVERTKAHQGVRYVYRRKRVTGPAWEDSVLLGLQA